jgi:hypothetical protein
MNRSPARVGRVVAPEDPRERALRFVAVAVVAILGFAPLAQAQPKRIKLTATVTGSKTFRKGNLPEERTVISVKQGSKKVGSMSIGKASDCAGPQCQKGGAAKLGVGTIKGNASLTLTFVFSTTPAGCVLGPPGCSTKPPKYGSGWLRHGGHSEGVRVNTGEIPTKKGSKFGIVLMPGRELPQERAE